MGARRPDDPAIFEINGDQCAPGFQGQAEEFPENLLLVTVFRRMLFPNERIGSYCVKVGKILRSKRPELEEFACQDGLEVKGYRGHGVPGQSPIGRTRRIPLPTCPTWSAAMPKVRYSQSTGENPASVIMRASSGASGNLRTDSGRYR